MTFLARILLPASLCFSTLVCAGESDQLGPGLTPLGAERDANADGRIPAWRGAGAYPPEALEATASDIRRLWDEDPAGYEALLLPDPGEKLFDITADNMAEHAEHLTEGHKALLQAFEGYFLPVYPGRRNAFVPEAINKATLRNARKAQLTGTDLLTGARLGTPFPLPDNGAQVIWNHRLRYRGNSGSLAATNLVVGGFLGLIRVEHETEALFRYGNLEQPAGPEDTLVFMMRRKILAPARAAGVQMIIKEHMTQSGRQVWMKKADARQVQRMPSLGYDEPNKPSGGQIFIDQADMFNGPLDRFDWQLVGKREVYVPANAVRLGSPRTVHEALLEKNHIHQDLTRYELRRVWIVEATLKERQSHAFSRRRFYVDEDSWSIVFAENYDRSGELWRLQEGHTVTFPYAGATWIAPAVYYDLKRHGRYVVQGLFSQQAPIDFDLALSPSHFEPEALLADDAEQDEKSGFWSRLFGS